MNCPNCGREMKYKQGTGECIDFSGTAEDWELEYSWEEYSCRVCKISYDGNHWIIPKNKLPTEKQKNTILFINNRLNMNLEALTKHQCWLDIGKYFDRAKGTPLHTYEWYEDMQEYFGYSEGDFY